MKSFTVNLLYTTINNDSLRTWLHTCNSAVIICWSTIREIALETACRNSAVRYHLLGLLVCSSHASVLHNFWDTTTFVSCDHEKSWWKYRTSWTVLRVASWSCLFRSALGDVYARTTGYNEVGELNNIIIIYPQAIATNITNPSGCWDFFGYTNSFYCKLNRFCYPQITFVNVYKICCIFFYFFTSRFQSYGYV